MPVERDGQWEVDGLLLGPGTLYPIDKVLGMGSPEIKNVDRDKPGDGGYAGSDYLGPREVIFEIGLDGEPDASGYDALIGNLGAAFAARRAEGNVLVRYQRFGRIRRFEARPRGLILPWDDDFHLGAAHAAARLIAFDPLTYSDTVESEGPGSGAVQVTNDGNYPVWPTITTAAGGDLTLSNVTTGESVSFVGLPSATIIDFAQRTAETTVGGTDVYGTIQANPAWWQVQPGLNDLDFSASVTIEFRHGWTTG